MPKKIKPNSSNLSVVEAIIKDSSGRILLLKRSKKNNFYVGKWQLPGGKVEFGENVQEAIKREIFEEVGHKYSNLRLQKVFSLSKDFGWNNWAIFLMVFEGPFKGKITLSEDHSESKFFKLGEIKKSSLTPLSKKAIFG
jgi:8-oxo-dGTP diphosphatase